MKGALPLVLAALLVCSLPAMAFPGAQASGPQPTEASPVLEDGDWLAPSSDGVASGSGHVVLDASATLDTDAAGLESRYEEHHLDVRLERAGSDVERRAIVREETGELERAVAELRERERDAYRAYHAGEIDERELAVELAAVHSGAVDLQWSVSSLSDHVESVPGTDRGSEFEAMAVETETMQGPVRERIAHALRGETDPARVHVEADATGVVLATVGDGQFYREAYRSDARDPTAEPHLHSLGESEERIAELYPEVFPAARWSYSEVGHGTHRGAGSFSEGTITVYLDRATTDAYREYVTLRLDGIETAPLESETDDGVRLSVEGTVTGGPAVVSITNDETDAPLSGAVAVDGRQLGTVDDEGELWIVLPHEPTEITASVGSTTVELTVDPSASGDPADADDPADASD
jgi:hypothetical protein